MAAPSALVSGITVAAGDQRATRIAAALRAVPAEVLDAYLPDPAREGVSSAALTEALKFLLLKALVGDLDARALSPEPEVDDAWHLLLLRPTEYAAICNALAGAIINHNPSGVADEELREARLGLARATYKATFGTGSRDFIAKREAPAAAAAPAAKRADRKIQIVVQTLTGKKLNVTVSNDASVLDLMEAVQGLEGIPVDQIRLIYNGLILGSVDHKDKDSYGKLARDKLAQHGIGDGTHMHLVLKLSGC